MLHSRWAWAGGTVVLLALVFWMGRSMAPLRMQTTTVQGPLSVDPGVPEDGVTRLFAHNILMRKGPHFRVYIRWIRGQMVRTVHDQEADFDHPNSFVLQIEKGMADAKLSDMAEYLNTGQAGAPPLKDITVENHDGELQIKGTAHKVISVPVRLDGELSPMPDGRIHFHLKKLNVLKVPVKGLFGMFSLKLDDLMPKTAVPGMEVSGNDIYVDTQRLLPPPHVHGKITSIQMMPDRVRVIYGGATQSEEELAKWHNFLRLQGGTVSFGKLTMRQADLTLIDASDDGWFDLDLANYQAQLVYGVMHTTEKAGIEAYMPDLDRLTPEQQKAAKGVSLEWLKNRNTTPALNMETSK
ncbi:MAG: hypothetical protein V4734_12045 [Terriglobus sp.]